MQHWTDFIKVDLSYTTCQRES